MGDEGPLHNQNRKHTCIHAVTRVQNLFADTIRLGLDYPTDKMLEDMVRDAEWNALWNPREIAEQHDQDMREMRRIWNMALGANVVEESELISERDWSQHLRIQLAAEVEKVNKLQEQLSAEGEKHRVSEGLLIEANKELSYKLVSGQAHDWQYEMEQLQRQIEQLTKQLVAEREISAELAEQVHRAKAEKIPKVENKR
jgi:hypothetical protein